MATFWTLTAENNWQAQTLGPGYLSADAAASRPFGLASFGQGPDRAVALLIIDGVQAWVNGQLVIGGLKVLAHRDEIQVGGGMWYYSAESPPLLLTFQLAPQQRRPRCGVCRVAIADGDTAVSCPRCGRLYHQLGAAGERPAKHCFTYRDRCLCGHPTSLSGETVWHPDKEETCV